MSEYSFPLWEAVNSTTVAAERYFARHDTDLRDPEVQARVTSYLLGTHHPCLSAVRAMWRWLAARGFQLRAPADSPHPFLLALKTVIPDYTAANPDRSLVGCILLTEVADAAGMPDSLTVTMEDPWLVGLGMFFIDIMPTLDAIPSWCRPLLDAVAEAAAGYSPPWGGIGFPPSVGLTVCALAMSPREDVQTTLTRPFLVRLIEGAPTDTLGIRMLVSAYRERNVMLSWYTEAELTAALTRVLSEAHRSHAVAARSHREAAREAVWVAQRAARPHVPEDVAGAGAGARSARDGVRPRLAGGMTAAIVRAHLHG
jgi:hypothetical protein